MKTQNADYNGCRRWLRVQSNFANRSGADNIMTMTEIQSLINRLTLETDQIASEDPGHRILTDEPLICSLVRAINGLAESYEELNKRLEQQNTETETGKNILAAFISEMPEGALICNAEGRIILYNRRAVQFLDAVIPDDSSLLGRSVFNVIDRTLIEHALDEISEHKKRNVVNAVSHFVFRGKANRILQAQVILILNPAGEFTGFILTFSDITRRHEAEQRADSLLQSLTKSARSPLASVRSAIEAIVEYPDMDQAHLRRFREIIRKESVTLSNILNNAASEYSALVKARRSLTRIPANELTETIRRRARDRLGILVCVKTHQTDIRVKADTYSLIIAILFVLNQLKNMTGKWEYTCQLKGEGKFAELDLIWEGEGIETEVLRKWEDQFLIIGEEKTPLTLKEVLEHHQAGIWGCADKGHPYIRFFLPVETASEAESVGPVTIVPESHAYFYNPDLFRQSGEAEADNRVLTELTYNVMIREISEVRTAEDLMGKHDQLPELVHRMLWAGDKVRRVTWLITAFSDAILKRLLDFAIKDMGPPPARFAFIILGSEGRKEQTLKTDQDNAIIFEDISDPSEREAAGRYFLSLGEKVCTWLDQAGYAFCEGEIMAMNPKWCQALSVWKEYFYNWIHTAEPGDLLHSSIFFDFRYAYGSPFLVDELSDYLFASLSGWTGFLRHLAENAVCFDPPLGLFGKFIVKSKGRYKDCLDIKQPMVPIVDFARLYAFSGNIRETNTQERLYQLYLRKILSREDYHEIEQAYSFMMQLRFVRQITAIVDEKRKPDNYINPKKLSGIEQKMLKEIFKKIGKIQGKLKFEFIGETE